MSSKRTSLDDYSERSKRRFRQMEREKREGSTSSDDEDTHDRGGDRTTCASEFSTDFPGSSFYEEAVSGHGDDVPPKNSSDSDSSDGDSSTAESRGQSDEADGDKKDDQGESSSKNDSDEDSDEEVGDSDTDDDDDENDPNKASLYAGAPTTVSESAVAILSYAISHNLSGSALADLLALVEQHCIYPNKCQKSLFKFRIFFECSDVPLTRHYYCKVCYSLLDSAEALCPKNNSHKDKEYFLEVPIISQIRNLFACPGFFEKLQHRFNRNMINSENIEDIYDGSIYKELSSEGNILSFPSNFSLMWYTDGIKIFKSSKSTCWPIVFSFNEMSYEERFKPENMLLVGLYFGETKPPLDLVLSVMKESFEELKCGVEVRVHGKDDPIISKGIVICGTCDLPAKAMALNSVQFNGEYGCAHCKQKGKRIQVNDAGDVATVTPGNEGQAQLGKHKGPGVQVYPFDRDIPLRTVEETKQHALEAYRTKKPVKGIKGPSGLLYLGLVSYITSTAIDSMHCVFSNVVQGLVNLWFLPAHNKEKFSLSKFTVLVDQRFLQLNPPAIVQRLGRGIGDRGHWKTSDFRNWFFYYSIPVLADLIDPVVFNHYLMLVQAIYLLNQTSVSPSDIDLSTRLLTEFVARYQDIYGLRHMTCNVHLLLHLPDAVRRFGPLWVTSCFPFENFNGVLKKFVHGTRFADLQVCRTLQKRVGLSFLKNKYVLPGSSTEIFCKRLSERSLRLSVKQISPSFSVVGIYKKVEEIPALIEDALVISGIVARTCYIFYRCVLNKVYYLSESYPSARKLKTDSTCVEYDGVNGQTFVGRIHCFCRLTNCFCKDVCDCEAEYVAVIKKFATTHPFKVSRPSADLSFVHEVHDTLTFDAVSVHNIKEIWFYLNVQKNNSDINTTYIVERVNREKE